MDELRGDVDAESALHDSYGWDAEPDGVAVADGSGGCRVDFPGGYLAYCRLADDYCRHLGDCCCLDLGVESCRGLDDCCYYYRGGCCRLDGCFPKRGYCFGLDERCRNDLMSVGYQCDFVATTMAIWWCVRCDATERFCDFELQQEGLREYRI